MKKTYTITMEESAEKFTLNRVNDGFSSIELLAMCAMLQSEILDQMRGVIKPDVVTRTVIRDDSSNGARVSGGAEAGLPAAAASAEPALLDGAAPDGNAGPRPRPTGRAPRPA